MFVFVCVCVRVCARAWVCVAKCILQYLIMSRPKYFLW